MSNGQNSVVILFLLGALCFQHAAAKPVAGCLDETGAPVDWWAALKYPHSTTYSYADANNKVFSKSSYDMASDSDGALSQTINQIYKGSKTDMAYAMYNDESPNGDKWGTAWGHFKGVLGVESDGGFWLVHSVPRLPETVANGWKGYPDMATKYGQSMLCTTLSPEEMDKVGTQMQMARGHIYDSNAPSFVKSSMPNLQAAIDGEYVHTADSSVLQIATRGGESFTSLVKSHKWGKELYEDLVAPQFQAGVYAETWQNGVGATPSFCNNSHTFNAININHLSTPEGESWTNSQDHSKWCVTMDRGVKVACIGDINRQHGQLSRGGGTLCFNDNEAIWESMIGLVTDLKKCG